MQYLGFWVWSITGSLISLLGVTASAQPMAQSAAQSQSIQAPQAESVPVESEQVELFQVESDRNASPQFAVQLTAQQNEVLTRAEVYKLRNQVEVLPFNQSARAATLSDVLVPQDAVRTAAASIAELLFNEGSIARVDANTVFRFREGLRRFQLPNRVSQKPLVQTASRSGSIKTTSMQAKAIQELAQNLLTQNLLAQSQTGVLQKEMIFVLESGTALLMSPPNSVGTRVETPESQISIIAPRTASEDTPDAAGLSETASGLLLPPDRSSAVMVVHDRDANSTRVFALTDGDIRVSDRAGTSSTPLIGGQTVAVTNGKLGPVETFDLENFYRTVPLAEGLGPGQESFVSQELPRVQVTLNAVRIETIAALRRQVREQSTFTGTFLRDALNGIDTDFDGQRGRRTELIIGGQRQNGTFRRTAGEDSDSIVTGTFTPDNDAENPVRIRANINTREGTIDGQRGRSNDAGLSGNDAVGTVRFDDGRVLRVEVFDVGGDAPDDRPEGYRGRLIRNGIQPDR